MGQEENITSHQFDNPRSPMYSDDTFLDVDFMVMQLMTGLTDLQLPPAYHVHKRG